MSLIEVKNISRRFQMGEDIVHALNNVTFSIEQGAFVSIIGPSGCGKTTLMNILGMLDQPDEGAFQFDSQMVQNLSDDSRAMLRNQKIGFVFQSFHLLSRMTALRNVELPLIYSASYNKHFTKEKSKEMAIQALKRVGLEDRMNHKPNELSGGQRQRVAIARALVNNPRIVLADEPTGNLDSKSGADILALFENLNSQGVTLILVTHDPKIASRTPRVISMLDGQIEKDYENK